MAPTRARDIIASTIRSMDEPEEAPGAAADYIIIALSDAGYAIVPRPPLAHQENCDGQKTPSWVDHCSLCGDGADTPLNYCHVPADICPLQDGREDHRDCPRCGEDEPHPCTDPSCPGEEPSTDPEGKGRRPCPCGEVCWKHDAACLNEDFAFCVRDTGRDPQDPEVRQERDEHDRHAGAALRFAEATGRRMLRLLKDGQDA